MNQTSNLENEIMASFDTPEADQVLTLLHQLDELLALLEDAQDAYDWGELWNPKKAIELCTKALYGSGNEAEGEPRNV